MKRLAALLFALFFATAAYGQNAGTVTNHAFAIGKGAGGQGYASLLCASAQIAVGQAAADPICRTLSGDATLSAAGVVTLATVNAGVGTFGSATQCIIATVNAKGLITAVSQTTCTPAIGSVTGLGTGVAVALATNIGSAGAPVLFNGAGGTPSSLTLTNATGLPVAGITGLGAGCGTFLGTPSSANLRGCLTDETGTGLAYFQGGDIGTPSAGNGSNINSLNASNLSTGTVAAARGGAGTVNGVLSGNGSGTVSQGSTAGLSDVTADSSWTPTDASGAGLSFTVLGARYSKNGKIVVAWFRLTYPATANGATASVGGLPTAASANYPGSNIASGTCFSSAGTNSNMTTGIVASATAVTFFNNNGAANILNSALSGLVVSCVITYVST